MKYILKNLDCPNCALKIEKRLIDEGILDAKVDFATSSLITQESNTDKIKQIIKEVEDEVIVIPENERSEIKEYDKNILQILVAFLPFVFAVIYGIFHEKIHTNPFIEYPIVLFILILGGWKTFLKAYRKIISQKLVSGSLFDENFLIALATISAIVIHETFEGLLLITLFNIGQLLEELATDKARKKIQQTIEETFGRVRIKTEDGNTKIISTDEVEVGDIILVKPGEKILLDGVVLEGNAFVDKSAITGEATPEAVHKGSKVIAGSVNLDGILEIRVESKFENTVIYKILQEVQSSKEKAKTQRFITKLSNIYTPTVILLALIVSFVPPILFGSYDFKDWIYKGLIIIVISCPCAIVISVPLTYFKSIGILASKGILTKNTATIDKLSEVKTMFFDKTGTITKGKLSIHKIVPSEEASQEEVINSSAILSQYSNHILSKSILHHINYQVPLALVSNVKEIPGYGIIGNINGEEVLIGNDKLLHEREIAHSQCITDSTVVQVAKNKKLIGSIYFEDKERDEAKEVIKELKELGIEKIYILTGDNEKNTIKISQEVGVDGVFYNQSPEGKAKIVEEYKTTNSKPIAYIGDGINDSIVMTKADVGISFNTPVNSLLISSSDIVINNSNLHNVAYALITSKNTKKIVVENILIALGIKLGVVALGILGIMPLWLAVLSDTGSALLTIANTISRDFSKHHHSQAQ